MATATAKVQKYTKVTGATLEMNEEEVITLLVILNRVGGCPSKSARRYADRLSSALLDALGVEKNFELYNNINDKVSLTNRSIYFNDEE